jgi:hypothetical protein
VEAATGKPLGANILAMFPQLSFSPTVNVNRQPKDKEQSAVPAAPQSMSTNELSFVLMAIALILMSGAVVALSGALLVHATKS